MSTTILRRCGGVSAALAMSLFPLTALSGCAAILANQVKATATERRSFDASAHPLVVVETFNGQITVKVATNNKIEATVTKTGSGANQETAEADLKNVSVDYAQEGETVRIVAKRTGPKTFGSSGASVDLGVPAGTVLALSTQNGKISTEAIQGPVTAHASNGDVEIHGGKGKLDLKTSNGAIEIEASQASVDAETSNGEVVFAGTLLKGSHSLATSNGSIELKLPTATAFKFEARTSNGSVTNRFKDLQPRSGKAGSNHLAGMVGSGSDADIDVRLESSNGSITIGPEQPAEATSH
jgi:DUF4097 and DUF4098 domain-containing protein YvlB